MNEPRARYSFLPAALAEIAEVAGLDAALKLAQARGGTEVYIPAKLKQGHWLIETVGEPAAKKICARYVSGVHVVLPLGPVGSIAKLRRTADRMIAEKRPAAEIARACGYTSRTIERRKRKARERGKPDIEQKSLF